MLMFLLGVMFIPTDDVPKTGAGMLHMLSVMARADAAAHADGLGRLCVADKALPDRGRSGPVDATCRCCPAS